MDKRVVGFWYKVADEFYNRDHSEYADAVSDAALGYWEAYKQRPDFALHYYHRIMKNKIIDGIRKRHGRHTRKPRPPVDSLEAMQEFNPSFDIQDHEPQDWLDLPAIRELAELVKPDLLDKLLQGKSNKQMSVEYGVTETAVCQYRWRFMALLVLTGYLEYPNTSVLGFRYWYQYFQRRTRCGVLVYKGRSIPVR